MIRFGHRSRHPDECRCNCHQDRSGGVCQCCWRCHYCRLNIRSRIKPESHADRCERQVFARAQKMDPTICLVTDPPKPRDHAPGCCRPCNKCGRFITTELLDCHRQKYCHLTGEFDDPEAA